MEGKFYKARENVAETLGIPLEIALDIPKISIEGNSRVVIENHKGLITFNNNIIEVDSKIGFIIIRGTELEVLFIGGNTLTIGGNIWALEYAHNEDER